MWDQAEVFFGLLSRLQHLGMSARPGKGLPVASSGSGSSPCGVCGGLGDALVSAQTTRELQRSLT